MIINNIRIITELNGSTSTVINIFPSSKLRQITRPYRSLKT